MTDIPFDGEDYVWALANAAAATNSYLGVGSLSGGASVQLDVGAPYTGLSGIAARFASPQSQGVFLQVSGTGGGGDNWKFGLDTSNRFSLWQDSYPGHSGNRWLTVETTGQLGLNTTGTAARLNIGQNTGTSGLESMVSLTNGVDSNFYAYVSGSASTDKRSVIGPQTNTALVLQTNSTERVRVADGGLVGIGRTPTANQLEIVNNLSIHASYGSLVMMQDANIGYRWALDSANHMYFQYTSNNFAGVTQVAYYDGASAYTFLGQATPGTLNRTLTLGTTGLTGIALRGSGSAIWYIDNRGNADGLGDDLWIGNGGGTPQFMIDAGGNVGINVTAASRQFHTNGQIRFSGLPTSASGLSTGDIWNDSGTLKIV